MLPRRLALLTPLLLSCVAESAVGSPLRERIDLIRAVHPSPTRTVDGDTLERALAERESTRGEFASARALRELLALVGDSHLAGELPPGDPNEATYPPLLVQRVAGVLRVDACADESLVGAAIQALNGEPIEALLDRLAQLSTVDGARPAVQRAESERRFAEHLRLVAGPRAEWTLAIADDAGSREVVVPGVTLAELQSLASRRQSFTPSSGPLPTVSSVGDALVLRLATFGTSDRATYLDEVDRLGPRLAEADPLILDLRGNEGGDRSLGVRVAQYILQEPFTQWARVRTRVREIPDRFRAAVRFPFGPESALTDFPGARTTEGWTWTGDPLAATMTPRGAGHAGALVLFVDDATNSAAIELAVALLAHHPNVRVVGTETQGECGWHVGQLPIVFEDGRGPAMILSLFAIDLVPYPGCRPGRGIEPDLPVTTRLEDFRSGRDPYLVALGLE